MAGKFIFGWDDTNKIWLPVLVDTSGRIKADLSNVSFLDLADTPASFTDQKGRVPRVNIDEDALEFIDPASLDWPLFDETEGDHFKQYDSSYPSGWTETIAALYSNTNNVFSFWFLAGSSVVTSWEYRKQTGVTIEDAPSGGWNSFVFGPLIYRDGAYTADVDYYFAIHGETGGAIDLSKYIRVRMQWNSAGGIWRVRGESDANDGGGQTASAWFDLSQYPLFQPLYFHVSICNSAAKATREYLGNFYYTGTHTMMQNVNENTTWGRVYWRISMARGAGIQDYIFLGSLDHREVA